MSETSPLRHDQNGPEGRADMENANTARSLASSSARGQRAENDRAGEEYRKALKAHHFKQKVWIILIHLCLVVYVVVSVYPLLRIFSVSLRPGDRIVSTD